MPRKQQATARRPILTETEAALDWELRRAREEVAILRKANKDARHAEPKGLNAAGIATLVRRMGVMFRNCVPQYLLEHEACPHCGNHSIAQIEAGFNAWADEEAQMHNHLCPDNIVL